MSTIYSAGSGTGGKMKRRSTGSRGTIEQLTDEQRHEIKEAFELFDGNKDRRLDFHELRIALTALGFELKKAEVRKIMKDYSSDGESLDWDSFEQEVSERMSRRDPRDEMRRAFKLFDDDDTGKISLRNLRRVCKELGEGLEEDELRAMIDEFDLDQDGEINEQEFYAIMNDEI